LLDNNDIKVDCEENIEDDSARIIEDSQSNDDEIMESDER
jgi:hypothetical protein